MQPVDFATSRGSITIREAKAADVSQYRELRLHALQNAPTAFSADYETNLNHPMEFWKGRLNFDEHGIIFFAEHGPNLIGMTGIGKGESPKTRHGAYIWGVYVRPEWRGLHIAEALIENCLRWAETGGVNIVKLGVVTSNASAVRCYQRCGFAIYGTEPRAIYYEGTYYEEYLMFRDLN